MQGLSITSTSLPFALFPELYDKVVTIISHSTQLTGPFKLYDSHKQIMLVVYTQPGMVLRGFYQFPETIHLCIII